MFRVKPYTKCIDCIRTDQFKCKSCMDKLVNSIMTTKDNFVTKQLTRKSPKSNYLLENKYSTTLSKSFSVTKTVMKPSTSS